MVRRRLANPHFEGARSSEDGQYSEKNRREKRLAIASHGVQLVLGREQTVALLHRQEPVPDVVPNFVRLALDAELQQIHHAHKFEMDRITVGILVLELRLGALALRDCKRRFRRPGFKNYNAFFAEAAFSRIARDFHAELEEQFSGIAGHLVQILLLPKSLAAQPFVESLLAFSASSGGSGSAR